MGRAVVGDDQGPGGRPGAEPEPSPPSERAVPGPSGAPLVAPGAVARTVLTSGDINRILTRMAHQILEKTSGGDDVVLLGIPTRGVPIAHRLADRARSVEGADLPVGSVDPTMFRDDLRIRGVRPLEVTTIPPSGVDGKVVVLVDDVLYSGRTVRAALDALSDLGRPRIVQLAVLIDRGHRELPIRADYVGKNMPTSRREKVAVRLAELDGVDRVMIVSPGESR
jgi:pyrimidine operon attenuation protein/uracil phosphoribosyltransferase